MNKKGGNQTGKSGGHIVRPELSTFNAQVGVFVAHKLWITLADFEVTTTFGRKKTGH